MILFANHALLASGWTKQLQLEISQGKIIRLSQPKEPAPDAIKVDCLLPAIANLHSHSFQHAMAGQTEYRQSNVDNFWTWRELMYRFVEILSPEDIYDIACYVFMKMQEAGYGSVAEFHYLHQQKDGTPYDILAETSIRIIEAAKYCGIGLTHLPVLYSYGGTDCKPLKGGQIRFGNDLERFIRLYEDCKSYMDKNNSLPDFRLGIAPHSLRATTPQQLKELVATLHHIPTHIHISEQIGEVESVKNWLGARPIEWLMANLEVNEDWCLIHATHMNDQETDDLAKSGAIAGLCPLTEANLGDGIFNAIRYWEKNGRFGIGSDSIIRISVRGELQQLEYSQRLLHRQRNILSNGTGKAHGAIGQGLYSGAAKGSAQALGREAGTIKEGAWADLLAIDSQNSPILFKLSQDELLNGWIFAENDSVITDLWSAGRHCVRAGVHIAHEEITNRYKKCLSGLHQKIG